jgi:hypothetical protein
MISFSTTEETRTPLREYDSGNSDLDIARDRIYYILRVCIDRLGSKPLHTSKQIISSNPFQGEFRLSRDGKKKQLMEQLVTEAVVLLTTHVSGERKQGVSENMSQYIPPKDGRRI